MSRLRSVIDLLARRNSVESELIQALDTFRQEFEKLQKRVEALEKAASGPRRQA